MGKIISLDQQWSLAINAWNSPWADTVMALLSNRFTWIPLYFLFVLWLVGIYKKKSFWILLGVALVIAVADLSSVHFFKYTFCRLRPCHEPMLEGLLNLPSGCGGQYGFISSHATNHFALAAYLSPWFARFAKRKGQTLDTQNFMYPWVNRGLGFYRYGGLYFWALLICYSRVYLAAHYIGDVVCGALWGVLMGLGGYLLVRAGLRYLNRVALSK